jgi:hypothetical protein
MTIWKLPCELAQLVISESDGIKFSIICMKCIFQLHLPRFYEFVYIWAIMGTLILRLDL